MLYYGYDSILPYRNVLPNLCLTICTKLAIIHIAQTSVWVADCTVGDRHFAQKYIFIWWSHWDSNPDLTD